jgi:hypothetical protein
MDSLLCLLSQVSLFIFKFIFLLHVAHSHNIHFFFYF